MGPVDELRIEVALLKKKLEGVELKLNALENEPTIEKSIPSPPTAPPVIEQPKPIPDVQPVKQPPVTKRPPQDDLEAQIGGNWLNRIGAATLIIGMAFFLKYAIDNSWINETARIIIGLLVGLGCLGLGEHFQKRALPQFAQGLSGAGVAILYFTIFASYSFYSLIPQLPAFMFMAVVTAVAIALSVRYDAVSVASLGIIGGFMTPILLSGRSGGGSGGSNIGVLIYIAILDIGILGITRFKNWRGLNLVSIFGTIIIFTNIAGDWVDRLGLSIGFATLYYLIFAGQAYVQNVMMRRRLSTRDFIMAIAPPVLYYWYCYSLLAETKYGAAVGPFAIVIAAAYVVLSHKVFLTAFEDRKLCTVYLTISASFLTIAVPLQVHGYWIVWGWGVEAAILSFIGFHLGSPRTRGVAVGVLWLASYTLLIQTIMAFSANHAKAFSDLRIPTYLLLTAITACMVYFYHSKQENLTENERSIIPNMLVIGGALLLLVGLSSDTYLLVQKSFQKLNPDVILTLLWLIYGLASIMLGICYKHRPIRVFALLLLGITLAKTYLSDVWSLDTVWRIVAFIGLGVILLAASYFYQKYRARIVQFVAGDGVKNEQK